MSAVFVQNMVKCSHCYRLKATIWPADLRHMLEKGFYYMPDESSALDQSCSRVFERRLLTFLLVEDYGDQQGSHAGSTDIHIFCL